MYGWKLLEERLCCWFGDVSSVLNNEFEDIDIASGDKGCSSDDFLKRIDRIGDPTSEVAAPRSADADAKLLESAPF